MTRYDPESRLSPDHAAAEFLIRTTLASPLRTYVASRDIAQSLDLPIHRAGQLIGELKDASCSGLEPVDVTGSTKARKWLFEIDRQEASG